MRNLINIITENSKELDDLTREKILSDPRCLRGVKIPKSARLWRGVGENSGSGMASYGQGLYFTCNRSYAARYGKVVELPTSVLPYYCLRFNTINDFQIWYQQAFTLMGYQDNRDVGKDFPDFADFIQYIDPSVDGLQIGKGRDAMFVNYGAVFITESSESNILTLWHGGRNLESDYQEIKAHAKGRWEHGPGLYLTSDRELASRYAKGQRRLYQVEIDITGAREISDVVIPLHDAIAFVERNIKGSKKAEFIEWLHRSYNRKGKLTANVIVNLSLNSEAISNTKTNILRQFLIDHGVDYAKADSHIYVVINPRIIKRIL